MENTVKPGIRINKSTLNKTITGIALLLIAIFAYLFLINKNPFSYDVPVIGSGQPKFSHMIYGGFGDDQLFKPMAVTTIGDKVFISDTNNHRIQVFTKDGTSVTKFGTRGQGKGQMEFPYGLTGDDKGRLLVADMYYGHISIFDVNGKFIGYFGEGKDAAKMVEAPTDLKFIDNKLYVGDVKKNRVFVLDKDGALLMELGKQFSELDSPNGISVDKKNGDIYITDARLNRVVVYDKAGTLLGQFNGGPKPDEPVVSNPRGIGISDDNTIYVVSSLSNMLYGYDNEYKQKYAFGGQGNGDDQFSLPNGLYIDEENNIYITDTSNNRVAVYR